jgi:hypothetical protein
MPMSYKKIAIFLLFILPIILLLVPGCGSSQISPTENSPTLTPVPTPTVAPSTAAPTIVGDHADIEPFLTISPPPKLGETADADFAIAFPRDPIFHTIPNPGSLYHSKAWVEFYWTNPWGSYSEAKGSVQVSAKEVVVGADVSWQTSFGAVSAPADKEVLIRGDVSWEGNALGAVESGSTLHLRSKVRFPREGIWKIEGFFTGEGWEKPESYWAKVAVTKDAGADLRKTDYKSGPLAYLGNFPYGDVGNKIMDEITAPVILDLDISKAPRVGEEAILSCRISSLHDMPDFSAQISFWKRLADDSMLEVSPDKILINGDVEWKGDLKQNEPVDFSASIKFPEEGDWEIYVGGNSPENKASRGGGFADIIRMNIGADGGSFGWEGWL